MSPSLVLREAAFEDIDDARRWYESKEVGLGERFVAAVERTLELVGQQPRAYAVVDNPIRRAVVRRFPYSVFFLDEDERVVVLAVFHQAMSPARLSERR